MQELEEKIRALEQRMEEVEKEMFDLIQSANSGMAEMAERIKALEEKK